MFDGISDAFRSNPIYFVAVAFQALGALVIGLIGLLSALRSKGALLSVFATILAFSSVAVGAFGTVMGRVHVDAAVATPGLSPRDRDRIRDFGYAEALANTSFAAIVALPGLALGIAGIFIARQRRRERPNAS
jgi:hypothetical protein